MYLYQTPIFRLSSVCLSWCHLNLHLLVPTRISFPWHCVWAPGLKSDSWWNPLRVNKSHVTSAISCLSLSKSKRTSQRVACSLASIVKWSNPSHSPTVNVTLCQVALHCFSISIILEASDIGKRDPSRYSNEPLLQRHVFTAILASEPGALYPHLHKVEFFSTLNPIIFITLLVHAISPGIQQCIVKGFPHRKLT